MAGVVHRGLQRQQPPPLCPEAAPVPGEDVGVAHPLLPPGVTGCPCRRVSRRCPSAARGASQALRRSASGPAGECLIAAGPRASPVSCLPPAEQPAAGTAPAFLPATLEGAQQPDEKRWVVTALPRSRHTPRDTALVPKSAAGRCGSSGDTAALVLAGAEAAAPSPAATGPRGESVPALLSNIPCEDGARRGGRGSERHRVPKAPGLHTALPAGSVGPAPPQHRVCGASPSNAVPPQSTKSPRRDWRFL